MTKELYYCKENANRIIKSDRIVIYGARIVANEVANCLEGKPYNKQIEAFMVTNKTNNPESLMGKPVITIEEGKYKYRDALIIVAVLEKYIDEIEKELKYNGFENVIICGFESDLWSGLRGNYFRDICLEKYGEYKTLEEEIGKVQEKSNSCVGIYSAKCHLDKKLKEKQIYPWEKTIQVGAALTEQSICDIKDNIGDNISLKNKEYCELTALYWIWKNDKSDYKGLGHYRRHFKLDEEVIEKLGNSKIDVILTIPILNFPSVGVMYANDHIKDDWNIMIQIIKEKHPEYYNSAIEIQNGIYYYAYNMIIAKKEIFDEYCEWLFSIIFECEKRCSPKKDKYQGRYLGFLSERLLSIFFVHNWNKWNIVHAEKNFLN